MSSSSEAWAFSLDTDRWRKGPVSPPTALPTVLRPGRWQAIVELVVAGLGVSVFPLWAIKSRVEAGALAARPISRSGVPLTWSALSLHGRNTPSYHGEFVRMMQKMDIMNRGALR